jgi:hypothetical protein
MQYTYDEIFRSCKCLNLPVSKHFASSQCPVAKHVTISELAIYPTMQLTLAVEPNVVLPRRMSKYPFAIAGGRLQSGI